MKGITDEFPLIEVENSPLWICEPHNDGGVVNCIPLFNTTEITSTNHIDRIIEENKVAVCFYDPNTILDCQSEDKPNEPQSDNTNIIEVIPNDDDDEDVISQYKNITFNFMKNGEPFAINVSNISEQSMVIYSASHEGVKPEWTNITTITVPLGMRDFYVLYRNDNQSTIPLVRITINENTDESEPIEVEIP